MKTFLFLIFVIGAASLVTLTGNLSADTTPHYTIKLLNSETRLTNGQSLLLSVTGLNNTRAYVVITDRQQNSVYGLIDVPLFTNVTETKVLRWTIKNVPGGSYMAVYKNFAGEPESSETFSVKQYDSVAVTLANNADVLRSIEVTTQAFETQGMYNYLAVAALLVAALVVRFSTPLLRNQIQKKSEEDKTRYYRQIADYTESVMQKTDPSFSQVRLKESETTGPVSIDALPDYKNLPKVKTYAEALKLFDGDHQKASDYLRKGGA